MSTQLSNLVYDLEHNALLAKQFMYSIVVRLNQRFPRCLTSAVDLSPL